MTEHGYKTVVIPCKVCTREFEFRCPIEFYEAAVAVSKGESIEFAGTCPDCRKDDPLLSMLTRLASPLLAATTRGGCRESVI